jgi:DNA-binding winged helix-turn-helix (wHTH) protein
MTWKGELMSVAWPNTHVEEANLRVHIGALRKLLGDHGTGARFIENIPGRPSPVTAHLVR